MELLNSALLLTEDLKDAKKYVIFPDWQISREEKFPLGVCC